VTHYLDASAWLKLYIGEPGSDVMRRIWTTAATLGGSAIGRPEVSAAICRRHAAARVDVMTTGAALARLDADAARLTEVALDDAQISRAVRLTRMHRLRAADAVHLAAALELTMGGRLAVTFVAADRELLAAAAAEGLATLDPTATP